MRDIEDIENWYYGDDLISFTQLVESIRKETWNEAIEAAYWAVRDTNCYVTASVNAIKDLKKWKNLYYSLFSLYYSLVLLLRKQQDIHQTQIGKLENFNYENSRI